MDITDESHQIGHAGIDKDVCVMGDIFVFDGQPAALQNILGDITFCSGHKQILLNSVHYIE